MPLYRWTDRDAVPGSANSHRRLIDGRLRFQTREGLWWTVHEELLDDQPVTGPAAEGARGRGALVFESDTMRHRVRDYPANWETLSGEALEELAVTP